jgi:hypothetical protein
VDSLQELRQSFVERSAFPEPERAPSDYDLTDVEDNWKAVAVYLNRLYEPDWSQITIAGTVNDNSGFLSILLWDQEDVYQNLNIFGGSVFGRVDVRAKGELREALGRDLQEDVKRAWNAVLGLPADSPVAIEMSIRQGRLEINASGLGWQ